MNEAAHFGNNQRFYEFSNSDPARFADHDESLMHFSIQFRAHVLAFETHAQAFVGAPAKAAASCAQRGIRWYGAASNTNLPEVMEWSW